MSLFDKVANQVGQNYLSKLGQISPLVKFGTDMLSNKLTSRVRAGDHEVTGGISLNNYRKVMSDFQDIDLARKNLFMVNVVNVTSGTAPDLNMFVIDYSASPFTVRGDQVLLGGGSFDNVTGVEVVRLSLTTFDDVGGSIKTWFKNLKRLMTPGDGTVGLPLDYLVRITITSAFADADADGADSAYIDSWVMRPEAIQHEGSRRDDGMQELQLSFIQWDTFTNLV
jgi:hypothetical protein